MSSPLDRNLATCIISNLSPEAFWFSFPSSGLFHFNMFLFSFFPCKLLGLFFPPACRTCIMGRSGWDRFSVLISFKELWEDTIRSKVSALSNMLYLTQKKPGLIFLFLYFFYFNRSIMQSLEEENASFPLNYAGNYFRETHFIYKRKCFF